MKFLLITILFILTTQYAVAQQCSTGCNYIVTSNSNSWNNINPNSETVCVTGNATLGNMNFNGSNNVLCIKSGVTLTSNANLDKVTVNVYGTFDFSGNINGAAVTVNIYSGGTFKYSGNSLSNGVFNNSGTMIFTNTGQVLIQGAKITNNTGGVFTATAPSKVTILNGVSYPFTNNGSVSFSNVENNDGAIYNNAGASLTFSNGTFQHGALHNAGSIVVNCPNASGGCSTQSPCMTMGNKTAGQFTNDATGSLIVHGDLCLGTGVIFHNNGTTIIDKNMNLENSTSQWVQGNGATTTVGGTTSNTNGGTFTGGSLCSGSVNGTVGSTISCGGAPPTINNITATTCKNIAISINVPATPASNTTITWSSLKIINGTDTVLATVSNPTLTTTAGTYKIYYNSTSASVLYTPATGYTGSKAISYKIASLSGSTTKYADAKTLTTTVNAPLNKPTLVISNP